MSIRWAVLDDAERMAEVHVAAWHAAFRGLVDDGLLGGFHVQARAVIWREVLSQSDRNALVAVEAGRVVGFIHFVETLDTDDGNRGSGEVTSIYVDPPRWRRGYGGELLSGALAELRTRRCVEANLWVFEANGPARRFYETHGFNPDGGRKTHPSSGLPEIRYRKNLAESVGGSGIGRMRSR